MEDSVPDSLVREVKDCFGEVLRSAAEQLAVVPSVDCAELVVSAARRTAASSDFDGLVRSVEVECCWAAGTERLVEWVEVERGTVEAAVAAAGSAVEAQRLDGSFAESR